MSNEHYTAESPKAVMSALADDDCRTILIATADGAMTVSELCEEHDIPTATAYRKVNHLSDLSLLDERIRVKPRGRNSREYHLSTGDLQVLIPESDAPVVTFRCIISSENDPRQPPVLSTDGGEQLHHSRSNAHTDPSDDLDSSSLTAEFEVRIEPTSDTNTSPE